MALDSKSGSRKINQHVDLAPGARNLTTTGNITAGAFYGDGSHLTGISTASANDALITITAGGGLTGGGGFTVDQAADAIITVSHSDTSSQASVANTAFNVIQSITLDTYGHITAIESQDIGTAGFYVKTTGETGTGVKIGLGSLTYQTVQFFAGTGLSVVRTDNEIQFSAPNAANWNTAYNYSTVGHLPLTGGTLSGTLNGLGANFTDPVTIYDNASSENPRLSVGRGATESLNIDVEDRVAKIYHVQDEGSGGHSMEFSINSPDPSKTFYWIGKQADATSPVTFMTLNSSGISATGYNKTNWDTAYGWGNHTGLYLPINGKAADSELIDGFDSTALYRQVYADYYAASPTSRWYVVTLPYSSSSGWSDYFYFDVLAYRDISNLQSQLHYRVYLHNRGISTSNNQLNASVVTELEQPLEFAEFGYKSGVASSSQFFIKLGEDYSGISIVAYPSENTITASMIAAQDTAPSGFTAVTPAKYAKDTINLQEVTSNGNTTNNSITALSFVKSGGTSSEFLKADGSVDSNAYLTTSGKAADSNLLDGLDSTYFDHRRYTDSSNYLGGHYVSGGTEKPNNTVFGAGKFKVAMLSGSNLGFGGSWNDVMWISTYSGGDVKSSHALVFDKYSSNVWVSDQNFDSASWGTGYLLITSANIGSQSVSYATNAGTLDSIDSSQFLRSDAADVLGAAITLNDSAYFKGSPSHGFRFNNNADSINSLIVDNSGNSIAYSSHRAPIFYDSNDTGYYLDPNSTSLLNVVRIGSNATQTFAQLNISNGIGAAVVYRDIDLKGSWAAGEGHAITATHGSTSSSIVGQMVFQHDSPGSRIKWGRLYHSGDQSTYPMHLISSGSSAYLEMNAGDMRAPIFYDSNDTAYYVDLNADLSVKVYGEISNSNYNPGNMQPGALNIGRIDTNYNFASGSWAGDIRAGILANCLDEWEFVVHDAGTSVESIFFYQNSTGYITMGRDLGWGTAPIIATNSFRAPIFYDSNDTGYYVDPNSTSRLYYIDAPQGYVSNGNPWGTSNSAFFPNGITTAGGTNWVYGNTYIGNAPSNGAGHQFYTSGTMESTGDHYAVRYYDYNNTTFYCDPNSTSRFRDLWVRGDNEYQGYVMVGGDSAGARLNINFDQIWTTVGNLHLQYSAAGNIDMNQGGGYTFSRTSLRAPIFYDYNNTGYYLDPASTSNLNSVNYAGQIRNSGTGYKSYNFYGMVGDYDQNSTSEKIIWTIGDSWNSIGNMYGLGYTYGAGYGHHLSIKNNGSTYHRISFASEGAYFTGTITASGDIVAYSDERTKENIKTIDNALEKVKNLRGVEFNKIGEERKQIGVIAQEIEKVLPEVVKEHDMDGMKTVAYGNIVGVLIEAIKEQQKQIEELKAIVNGITK